MRVAQVVGTRNISQLKKNPKVYEPEFTLPLEGKPNSLRKVCGPGQTVYRFHSPQIMRVRRFRPSNNEG